MLPTAEKKKILLVDDEVLFLEQFSLFLKAYGYQVRSVSNPNHVIQIINNERFDCILLDVHMPGLSGIDLLEMINTHVIHTPIIMLSKEPKVKQAVKALKLGAVDFIDKLDKEDEIIATIKRNIEHEELNNLREAVGRLQEELKNQYRIIAMSPVMEEVLFLLQKAASSDVPVLLVGETGVGKTYFARFIHNNSPRALYPFREISMANVPRELLESELFGYGKGAFTGANSEKKGLLQLADKGTIFFDEIGELPLEIQPKLNQFLDFHKFVPLGKNKEIFVDVRVISATNKPLEDLQKGINFRNDLFYRLSTIIIKIPPLRERIEDIWPMTLFFFEKYRMENPKVKKIHPLAKAILEGYSWPGNVRELESFIRRLIVLADDEIISDQFVRMQMKSKLSNSYNKKSKQLKKWEDLKTARERFEKEYIQMILETVNYSRTQAAKILNIDRVHLQRKIKRLNIPVK